MGFLYNLFAAAGGSDTHEKIPINVSEGLIVFFLGMLTIFAVLTLLILFFWALKLFSGQKKIEKKVENIENVVAPVAQLQVQPVQEESYDEEVVAAITAAISCVLSAEVKSGEPTPFIIKKIRHI